jgi:hypothetical protein
MDQNRKGFSTDGKLVTSGIENSWLPNVGCAAGVMENELMLIISRKSTPVKRFLNAGFVIVDQSWHDHPK